MWAHFHQAATVRMKRIGPPLIAIAWGVATGYYIFADPLKDHFEKEGTKPPTVPPLAAAAASKLSADTAAGATVTKK